MKNRFLFVLFAIGVLSIPSHAQCKADAGDSSIVLCYGDTITLGGNPSAFNGVPPYTYSWSIEPVQVGALRFYASHFLNDTTLSNPEMTESWGEKLEFFLTVTDANNCTSRDSIRILFSQYTIGLGFISRTINKGDSVYLNNGSNIGGGIGSKKYVWRPNHGLRDSTSLSFWAKPDSSIEYYLTVTDSVGCHVEGPPYYKITVNPTSNPEAKALNQRIRFFPNPASELLRWETGGLKINEIRIVDVLGRDIKILNKDRNEGNISGLPTGVYFIVFDTAYGLVRKKLHKL